jgi:opacity protein-like surface antigen
MAFQSGSNDLTLSTHSSFLPANMEFQIGGFEAYQGESNNIGIQGLIGDQFTITRHHDQNILLGLGYFIEGYKNNWINLMYGLNAFYLFQTSVAGNVIQEDRFTNLSYHYQVNNLPIYLAGKAIINNSDRFNLVLNLGIGPNFMTAENFSEGSLDGGITIPDNAFNSHTQVAFSASAGIGIRYNNLFGCVPVEVGYRYFYLGKGHLNKANDQIDNNLNTGSGYANALVISIFTS